MFEFKLFPEFTPLNLDHRQAYETLMAEFPAYSDLSFTTLMLWWNLGRKLAASTLNGNIVLRYDLPGDDRNSGLALVGRSEVKESIEAIFQAQVTQEKPPRLIHVPEFVIKQIDDLSAFQITEEIDYNEYILDPSKLYPLSNADHNNRRKVKKFIKEVGESKHVIESLDLQLPEVQKLLVEATNTWHSPNNDPTGIEKGVIVTALTQAKELKVQNLCLFIDGRLEGLALFQISRDRTYMILNHLKVSNKFPRMCEYMTFMCAQYAVEHGIPLINLEMDLGIPGVRRHKIELRPIEFLRKYTIEPQANIASQ